jgi:hypothetical protein
MCRQKIEENQDYDQSSTEYKEYDFKYDSPELSR